MMDRETSSSSAVHNARSELSALQVGGMCGGCCHILNPLLLRIMMQMAY